MKPIKAVLVAAFCLATTALLITACVGSGGSGDGTYEGESGFPAWQSGDYSDYLDYYADEEDHHSEDASGSAEAITSSGDTGTRIDQSGETGIGVSGETGIGVSGTTGIGVSGEVGIGTSSDTGVGTDGGTSDTDDETGLPSNCLTGCEQILASDQTALECLSEAIPELPLPNNMSECQEGLEIAIAEAGTGTVEEACDMIVQTLVACGGATADQVDGSATDDDDDTTYYSDDDDDSYGTIDTSNCEGYCSDVCSNVPASSYDTCYDACMSSCDL